MIRIVGCADALLAMGQVAAAQQSAPPPTVVDAVELGYKGSIAGRLFVDAVAYQSWHRNFISPLSQVANPAAAEPTFGFYADGTPVAAGTPAEGTLFTYVNFGEAQVRGADRA